MPHAALGSVGFPEHSRSNQRERCGLARCQPATVWCTGRVAARPRGAFGPLHELARRRRRLRDQVPAGNVHPQLGRPPGGGLLRDRGPRRETAACDATPRLARGGRSHANLAGQLAQVALGRASAASERVARDQPAAARRGGMQGLAGRRQLFVRQPLWIGREPVRPKAGGAHIFSGGAGEAQCDRRAVAAFRSFRSQGSGSGAPASQARAVPAAPRPPSCIIRSCPSTRSCPGAGTLRIGVHMGWRAGRGGRPRFAGIRR
mmetsp:Transcript_82975/g.248581  ORF Transcript_82975/g.248581 Transcript_82975/m.248581 type:complete len:261 (+) Transcript_82975:846-1628(+)